jgi:hydrogenase-1 operon protein HyaF
MSTSPHGGVPPHSPSFRTGMADAVLREIAGLLDRLIEAGEEGAIDLRSLPMTDGDREELKARLGTGEVHATLDVAGPSTVEETAISGVWWIRHEGGDGRVASEQIAVTRIPAILITDSDDLAAGAGRLRDLIGAEDSQPNGKTADEQN